MLDLKLLMYWQALVCCWKPESVSSDYWSAPICVSKISVKVKKHVQIAFFNWSSLLVSEVAPCSAPAHYVTIINYSFHLYLFKILQKIETLHTPKAGGYLVSFYKYVICYVFQYCTHILISTCVYFRRSVLSLFRKMFYFCKSIA
jgi:hypothetical protein